MKYFSFILILFLTLIGCQDVKAPEKPDNLISEEKMVNILTEAYLANAARTVDNKSIIEAGIAIDTIVYKNFGVDSLQFAKNNGYYAGDVEQYTKMFKKVQARLDVLKKKMDSIQQQEREKNDGIKNKNVDGKQKSEPAKDSLI